VNLPAGGVILCQPQKDCSFAATGAPGTAVRRRSALANSPASIFGTWSRRTHPSCPRQGSKERIVPYGAKAQEALEKYWPLREQLLEQTHLTSARQGPHAEAVFLNYSGRRLTQRSVGRIVKKYVRIANVNWDLHPHSLRHAFATHLLAMVLIFAPFRNFSAINHSPPRRNIPTPPSAS